MNNQTFQLPYKGINKGIAVCVTPSEYSSLMLNVRPTDVLEKRIRLGKRPGLKKWGGEDQIGGEQQPIVAMTSVSTVAVL